MQLADRLVRCEVGVQRCVHNLLSTLDSSRERQDAHPLLGYIVSPDQAFGVLRRFLADSRHRFVPADLSFEDRVVRTDLKGAASQVTDHYLVALVRQHGLTRATFDEPLVKAFGSELGLVELVR